MINITEKAANKVKEMSEELGVGHWIVRAKVLGGGCGGYQVDIEFDDNIQETDEISELDGVKIICDQMSFQYIDSIVMDYAESDFGGGFIFTGGEIKSTCGCGKSFSI
jgi:iron-sulfur cluster insertion protein